MINPLRDVIDLGKLSLLQLAQYSERLLMAGTVPAAGEQLYRVDIGSLGAFVCLHFTGSFSTLALVGGVITDTGINYLFGRLQSGGEQRVLFNDYTPLNILLSPGRERSPLAAAGAAGDPPGPLVYPMEFPYLFPANGQIQMIVRNTSTTDNTFNISFFGVRVKTFGKGDRNR
jgi:hypothetical protein